MFFSKLLPVISRKNNRKTDGRAPHTRHFDYARRRTFTKSVCSSENIATKNISLSFGLKRILCKITRAFQTHTHTYTALKCFPLRTYTFIIIILMVINWCRFVCFRFRRKIAFSLKRTADTN